MGFADLHIHSTFSDGTMTPAQIVHSAREHGVELISVCDHNEVRGTLETARLAAEAGLSYICGVEIDALFEGGDVHILCYGADLRDGALLARIRHARAALDAMSDVLLARLLPTHPQLDAAEYAAFLRDGSRGGWKMLQYLQAKGVTAELKAGIPLYADHGVRYEDAGFDAAQDVIRAIHAADGRAVLAHPGVTFPCEDLRPFGERVESALAEGFDGVECYYPHHSAGVTRRLVEICRRHGAMITAGSDCHGAFNGREIGQTHTDSSKLALNGLALHA